MSRQPAVFLDRDGTLIEDVGILTNPENISIFTDTVEALLQLQKKYSLFVVTNQSGVAHGKITIEEVSYVNCHLDNMLKEKGVIIKKWYTCPHTREDRCKCIKPNSTFLLQAAEEFNLSLDNSFFIGDHPHDIITGEKEGVFGLYVLTGHGKKHLSELQPEKLTFHMLGDAAEWIDKHPDSEKDLYSNIRAGSDAIKSGNLVAFPTETVYGLGANAFNPNAVADIFKAKKRPLHDPLIVHVSEKQQVESLVTELSSKANILIEHFWPGPLTLVLPKSFLVSDIVTAGNPTVAIRMPENPWALELIRQAETPIAAPSANLFGCTSPTTAQHVRKQLSGKYAVLIDGGACRVGIESTVLSLINNIPVLLRPGGISIEELESIIGPVQTPGKQNSKKFISPGLLPNHYAPKTPLVIFTDLQNSTELDSNIGVLLLEPSEKNFTGPVEVLSEHGDLREAAVNLYAAIRRLDSLNLDMIATHHFPDSGFGVAINDRLSKASTSQ